MHYQKHRSPSFTSRRSGRGLHIEHLEPRCLLAGDTWLVNFQNDEATPVTRYLVDSGEVFGPRGGGLSYGWSSDHTDQSRERSINPDQRLDTLIHFEAGQNWEFALPNGNYEVTASVGDPFVASNHTLNVEGVNFWGNPGPIALAANQFATKTMVVTVSDGELTLDQGAAPNMATRINYVHIVGVPSGPNTAPNAPTITEPEVDGQEVHPGDVHMEAIGFSDPDLNLHKSTDWEIWTVGPGAEPVWQTLGIQGGEALHTHMGDGIFLNSRAGFISLASNTDHQLRVRFRDDGGAVSAYATRLFHTGPEFAVFPMELEDILASPAPSWINSTATPIELPDGTTILSPGDPIIAIDADGGSNSPGDETVINAIDGTLAKYLNFAEVNSGFIVTPANPTIVTGFQITTANDAVERDPSGWQLFGTNAAIVSVNHSTGTAEPWTLIGSGPLALPGVLPNGGGDDFRNTVGPTVNVTNSTSYASYKMIFTGVKNAAAANSMQIAEIAFFGSAGGTPTLPEMRVEGGSTGGQLLTIEGAPAPGNIVTNPGPLTGHDSVRVVFESGSVNLGLGQSTLTFDDNAGVEHTIYLPAINLPAGQRLDLWVATDGSTYFGTAAQTEPNFNNLARQAPTPGVPYVATQAGFVIDQVGSGYRLPVNIAFVPNPGPDPDDPLYYVTELYGSIQVVTRNGTKHQFATGLLDYNPQGPISGTGEQGLTGIAVQRDAVNPEIYHLYVGMLWDNGAPAGGLNHYPKVERIDSAVGGLTMAAVAPRTVLLNMQPETQGQSHQISNISIGPDGKLYVHMGDGINTPQTALDLDMFRGKILRMNLDGTAPTDNPFYDASNGINSRDYIFAYGFRNPFGGAWRASDGKHYEVENGPSTDRFAQVNRGVSYGWNGNNSTMTINAIYNWNPAAAPVNIAFVQRETFGGSQFPASKMDHAFVSESGPTYAAGAQANGKRITEFVLNSSGALVSGPTKLIDYIGSGRSSVVGLAAGPDGLYFTELYEETGANGATAVGARIFRVRYVNPITGDYDIDGDVDNDDLTVWRNNYGSNLLTAADGNKNGEVDAADYIVWRNAMAAAAAASATVTVPVAVPTVTVPVHDSANPADAASNTPLTNASVGVSVKPETAEIVETPSARLIDLALTDLRGLQRSGVTAGPHITSKSLAIATTDTEASLLLTIRTQSRDTLRRFEATTEGADNSTDDDVASEIDDLISEFGFERLQLW